MPLKPPRMYQATLIKKGGGGGACKKSQPVASTFWSSCLLCFQLELPDMGFVYATKIERNYIGHYYFYFEKSTFKNESLTDRLFIFQIFRDRLSIYLFTFPRRRKNS